MKIVMITTELSRQMIFYIRFLIQKKFQILFDDTSRNINNLITNNDIEKVYDA